MNELNAFIQRIEEVEDRFVLLTLLADIDKLSKWNDLSNVGYLTVLKALLTRISESLLGQLTTSEFETNFVSVFNKNEFAEEILTLLIHALDDVSPQDVYKFSKLIDVINLVMENLVLHLLTNETSTGLVYRSRLTQSVLARTVCSFSDRLFNHFGTMRNFVACGTIVRCYEEKLLSVIKTYLIKIPSASSDLGLCAEILAGYFNNSETFISSLVKWMLENRTHLKIVPAAIILYQNVDFRRQEQLVAAVIDLLRDGREISIIFDDLIYHNALLRRIFTRKLLIECVANVSVTTARTSLKIVQYFRVINAALLIRDTFAFLVRVFTDQARLLNVVAFDQHFQLATAIIDFTKALRQEDIVLLREQIIIDFTLLVPEYLKLPDNCRRQLGMFVTEFVMSIFVDSSENLLHFDYNSDPILIDLRRIADENIFKICDHQDEPNGITAKNELKSKVVNSKSKDSLKIWKEKTPKKTVVDFRTLVLDSDDDEDVENSPDVLHEDDFSTNAIEEKFIEEEIRDYGSQEQNQPCYLRDCLECLANEKEDFKSVSVTFSTLSRLVHTRAIGFKDFACEIFDRMIWIEDRFRLPDFQFSAIRNSIGSMVLVHRPELVGHAVRVIFSRQCTMPKRFFILDCIEMAAAKLADDLHIFKNNLTRATNTSDSMIEVVEKIVVEKSEKQLGKVTRRNTSNGSNFVACKPNGFSDFAPQFIYPLLNTLSCRNVIGDYLNLQDQDHILMGKILCFFGKMIIYARLSPHLPQIVSNLLAFLYGVRVNASTFVFSGCLYCYGAIADGPFAIECYKNELTDALEWMAVCIDGLNSTADPAHEKLLLETYFKLKHLL